MYKQYFRLSSTTQSLDPLALEWDLQHCRMDEAN